MNKDIKRIENWQLITVPHKDVLGFNSTPTVGNDLTKMGFTSIIASVPGNFELDLMRENIIPDLYYGTNTLLAQKLENLHLYYFTTFNLKKRDDTDCFLAFNGIDTVAEIFIDGKKFAFTENMLHPHTFNINNLLDGKHDLMVHILPSAIYARQFEVPAMCFGLPYNHDSINLRKAPYMFGWDIMPRLVSGGLYKPVELVFLPKTRIENPFTATRSYSKGNASLYITFDVKTDADFMNDFTAKIQGSCKDSYFEKSLKLFNAHQKVVLSVKNPYLWWPKNYGEQNLYNMQITLYRNGVECDKVNYKMGIRTVYLRRSSTASDEGDFCFIVNAKRIFCLGTNWVPTDAYPSRHDEYELRGLELANDLNCNMIRCWGGNTYPSTTFYDYCDEHGIMIWQDFAMGCGHYPDNERLCNLMKEEVKQVALKYRNHPSLVLYAGDNECDIMACPGTGTPHEPIDTTSWINPNLNKLTRDVVLRELRNHDATRPYLPSSPYIDDYAFLHGVPSESHIWGPRDYFKGDYYKNPPCHFASEIGYHGCPSPLSLEKFIPKDSLNDFGNTTICKNENWLTHATAMEFGDPEEVFYNYRIPLMVKQVERIFGDTAKNTEKFIQKNPSKRGSVFAKKTE